MAYPFSGTLRGHEKGQSTDICYNVGERPNLLGKRAREKGHLLPNSTDMRCPRQASPWGQIADWWPAAPWRVTVSRVCSLLLEPENALE